MADKKISQLDAVVTPAGGDEFPINQSNASKKMTLTQIKNFTLDGGHASATFNVITDLQIDAGDLEKKQRAITVTDGVVTNVGDESDWILVGAV